jgi:hypothetical protein
MDVQAGLAAMKGAEWVLFGVLILCTVVFPLTLLFSYLSEKYEAKRRLRKAALEIINGLRDGTIVPDEPLSQRSNFTKGNP